MGRPIVYGTAGSTYVWSVRLALAEKGVAHELVEVGFGAHRKPRIATTLRQNPGLSMTGFSSTDADDPRHIDEAFRSPLHRPICTSSAANQIMGIVDARLGRQSPPEFCLSRWRRVRLPTDEAAISRHAATAALCFRLAADGRQPHSTATRHPRRSGDPAGYFRQGAGGRAPLSEYPNIRPCLRADQKPAFCHPRCLRFSMRSSDAAGHFREVARRDLHQGPALAQPQRMIGRRMHALIARQIRP